MPSEGPVSITRQCVYAAVPVLDIYSAYRIRCLRKYIGMLMLIIVIPQVVMEFLLFGGMLDIQHAYTAFLAPGSENFAQSAYVVAWTAGGIVVSITLIRRWSVQWNHRVGGAA